MNKKDIDRTMCPYCGGGFEIMSAILVDGERLIHAILVCACGKYPILSGILFLSKDATTIAALEFIERKEKFLKRKAFVPVFLLKRQTAAIKTCMTIFTQFNVFGLLSFNNFVRLFELFGFYKTEWARYLLQRLNDKDLQHAVSNSKRIGKSVRILDVASGAGHFLFFLKRIVNQKNIWAIDSSIVGLYLSQNYFAPKANYIYFDVEKGMPFKNKVFDTAFMNDALHYIRRKKSLAKNIQRVTKTKGRIILTNLHNKKVIKPIQNSEHFPEYLHTYLNLFPSRKPHIFSESKMKKSTTEELDLYARKFTIIFS